MKAETEELPHPVLRTCETLSRPTFRNPTESFEGWAYRNGLLQQLQRLEKRRCLEQRDRLDRRPSVPLDRSGPSLRAGRA